MFDDGITVSHPSDVVSDRTGRIGLRPDLKLRGKQAGFGEEGLKQVGDDLACLAAHS